MLQTNQREIALQMFACPDNHQFDYTIITTYSLNIEALLLVPRMLSLGAAEKTHLTAKEERDHQFLQFVQSIREVKDKLLVFFQADAITPFQGNVLFSFLEGNRIPIAKSKGLFHPKVWIVRFQSQKNPNHYLYRVGVMSRNLTFDKSWDVAIFSEGIYTPKNSKCQESADLAKLLQWLYDNTKMTQQQKAMVAEIQKQIGSVSFAVPPGFDDEALPFRFLSDAKEVDWFTKYRGTVNRILAISPFVSAQRIEHLSQMLKYKHRKNITLVSRQKELDKIRNISNLLKGIHLNNSTYVMLEDSKVELEKEKVTRTADDPRNLHAKLYMFEQDEKVLYWLGSANLTDAAWAGNNIEMMVCLSGKSRKVGIDKFWFEQPNEQRQEKKPNRHSFRGLCTQYIPNELEDPETDTRGIRNALLQRLEVFYIASNNEKKLQTKFVPKQWAPFEKKRKEKNLQIRIRPMAYGDESTQAFAQSNSFPLTSDSPMADISAVFVFGIYEDKTCIDQFALQLVAHNFPEDRDISLARELIIKRPQSFFATLAEILHVSLDPQLTQGTTASDPTSKEKATPQQQLKNILATGNFLEGLIRVVRTKPEKLRLIKELLQELPTENNRLLAEFLDVWNAFAPFIPTQKGRE